MVMVKIELESATIELLEPDLVYIVYKDEYEVGLKDVKEVDRSFLEIAGDSTIYAIMNAQGKYNIFSSEAQDYLSKKTQLVKNGQLGGFAVIINGLPYRILIKLYLKFYKPNYKLKICSNFEEAKDWLSKLKKTEDNSQ